MTSDVLHKKQKFFDLWAPNYDFLLTSVFYQATHKRLLEYVELPEQANVLDLGCGTGRLVHRLATEFPTLKGTGLDFSAQMLRQAEQHNRYQERLIYKQGNAESLPFANGEFDAVFNTLSFLHYPHPQRVISEVSRVLRPNGRFYLVDPTIREETMFYHLPFTPGGIRVYTPQQREQFGLAAHLQCLGHHYLLGAILLTVFIKPSNAATLTQGLKGERNQMRDNAKRSNEGDMERQRTFSGVSWETKVGYCRAIRAGNHIYVSGTAPIDSEGKTFAPGDAYAQTCFCLQRIQKALQDLGSDCQDVVRTRLYVTDISRHTEYAQAHQEFFAACPPASTMVEIRALVDPEMLVEVEVEAICQTE